MPEKNTYVANLRDPSLRDVNFARSWDRACISLIHPAGDKAIRKMALKNVVFILFTF